MASRLGRVALDVLFPPRCVGCGGGGAFLCDGCLGSMSRAAPPRCARCWQPGRGSGVCRDCRLASADLDGLRAAFVYEGTARELVHSLKYRGMTALGGAMASLLAAAARQHGLDADLVVPVPLAGLRRRLRGYNQAQVLARSLGEELGLPVRPRVLVRHRHTQPQARSADAEARRRNVSGAFLCREPAAVAGRRVLLVDDVATTGATLAECASAVKAAGGRSVWGLVFARED